MATQPKVHGLFHDELSVLRIGFTGTQQGMSAFQKYNFKALIQALISPDPNSITEFHHGDCVGADEEAHYIARKYGCRIVVHPPVNGIKRANTKGDVEREPLPYHKRNQNIVNATTLLIGCPSTMAEQLRSGTWSTIRYGRSTGTKIHILYPKPSG